MKSFVSDFLAVYIDFCLNIYIRTIYFVSYFLRVNCYIIK